MSGFGLAPVASPFGCTPSLDSPLPCQLLDVRDWSAVQRVFADAQPEIVFHLAAQPLVRASYDTPVDTFSTNVMGTVHVLEAARRTDSVQALVNVTSDKCYENREWPWPYRENEAMGGYDPYSASKGCSELVTAAYRQSFAGDGSLRIATARAGNVIGGSDWSADRLIPDIARAILLDQQIVIRRPHSIRPWQHVLEALSGYLQLGSALLANELSACDAWNFGPHEHEAVCVRELAQAMVSHWQRGEIVEIVDRQAVHEAHYLKLDSSKARTHLDWAPLLSTPERISWTVDWYRSWSESPELYWSLMDEQLENYERRLSQWANRKLPSSPAVPALSAPSLRAA